MLSILLMTCAVLGAGLLGSYLGAAAEAPWAARRRGGAISEEVVLPDGPCRWQPQDATLAGPEIPRLIATRVHHGPWSQATPLALAAQNGIGQPVPVVVCFVAIDRDEAGRIVSTAAQPPRLVVGPVAAPWQAVFSAWRRHGVIVDEVADVRPAQWEKAILNATLGPLCLATGLPMAALWAHAQWRDMVLAACAEGEAVAAAAGIALAPDLPARAAGFFAAIINHRPSVLADPGELPWIFSPLLEAANAAGLAVPALARIEAMVAEHLGEVGLVRR